MNMKKAVRIVVFNHKGGVGKTTTAINLAASLVHTQKKRVLVVDMDPQANATRALMGREFGSGRPTVKNVLLREGNEAVCMEHVIVRTAMPGLVVAPSDLSLSEAEFKLSSAMRREFILKDALTPLEDTFDFILIDCPPSLGLLTLNALAASDSVLIVCECQYLALRGIKFVLEILQLVQERLNPKLRILGVAATKYYVLSRANQEALQCLRGLKEQVHVFSAVIPRDVKAEEAPSHGKPLLSYAVDSRAAQAYLKLAAEVMNACPS